MNNIESKILGVRERLNRLSKKIKLIELLKGFSTFFILALIVNVLLSTVELFGLNSVEERTILFFIGVIALSMFAITFVIVPIVKLLKPFRNKEFLDLAGFVGTKFPEIKDKLLNDDD